MVKEIKKETMCSIEIKIKVIIKVEEKTIRKYRQELANIK